MTRQNVLSLQDFQFLSFDDSLPSSKLRLKRGILELSHSISFRKEQAIIQEIGEDSFPQTRKGVKIFLSPVSIVIRSFRNGGKYITRKRNPNHP